LVVDFWQREHSTDTRPAFASDAEIGWSLPGFGKACRPSKHRGLFIHGE
jgi:hypothetical protein